MIRPKPQERDSFFLMAQSNVSAAVVACLPLMKTLFSIGLNAQTQRIMVTQWLQFAPANASLRSGYQAAGIADVNMMTWPVKHDFRLRSEALRSAGQIGDIFRIERMEPGGDYEYYVEIIPLGTSDYDEYFARCTNKTSGGSKRVWGYYGVAETEN